MSRRTQGALWTVSYDYTDVSLSFAWIDTPVHSALILLVLILLLSSAVGNNGINAIALVSIVVAAILAELPPAKKISESSAFTRRRSSGSAREMGGIFVILECAGSHALRYKKAL